ncbi:MAG TPA: ankyrin repeat domain-containing protein [Capsulimonadaceae bacterium]|jgi:hypothetical protein
MKMSFRRTLLAVAVLLCPLSFAHAQAPAPLAPTVPTPYAGELIVRGVAVKADPAWRYVLIDSLVVSMSDTTTNKFSGWRHKVVTITDKTQIFDANFSPKSLTDITPGKVLSIVGNDAGVGKNMEARQITLTGQPDPRPFWRVEGYKVPITDSKLLVAAKSATPDRIKALVKAGANVNAADSDGHTALWYAVAGRNLPALKTLIGLGADVDARDSDGVSLLAAATRSKDAAIIATLKTAGAR